MTIAGSVTLTGAGQVTLQPDTAAGGNNCGSSNYILSNGAAATLDNFGNTISGGGQIGDSNLTVINEALGVIDANVSGLPPADEALFIDATSFTNYGTLEATGGGILQIGTTGTTWINVGLINDTGGSTLILGGSFTLENVGQGFAWGAGTGDTYATVNVDATSTVELAGTLTLGASVGVGDTLDASQGVFKNLVLNGADIVGGRVVASGAGGSLQTTSFVNTTTTDTIHDSLVENAGTWNIGTGGSSGQIEHLVFDGVLNNTGTVALVTNNCCNNSFIRVGTDGLTLEGGGNVTFAGNQNPNGNQCIINGFLCNGVATTLENVNNTISGAGQIGDSLLTVKNDAGGVIDANVNGQYLNLAPSGLIDNFGTIEATNGGILIVGGGGNIWTNEKGATISATGSTLDLIGFNNLGTINATNSTVVFGGNDTFANFGNFHRTGGSVTLRNGTLNLGGQTIDTTTGNFWNLFVDNGTIDPGKIIDGVGGTLGFSANTNNTLSNVTVDGGLNISSADSANNAFVRLDNGTKIMDAKGAKPGHISIGDGSIAANVDFQGYSDLVNSVTLRNGGSHLYFSDLGSLSSLSTGFDAANDPPATAGGQNDAHWTVNGNPAVILSHGSIIDNTHSPDNASSGWIDVADGGGDSGGLTTFSTTFNLADAAAAQREVLAGLFWMQESSSCGASAVLDINGHQISSTSDNCNTNGALFYADDSQGWFQAGTNTLSITTNGNGCGINHAIRLEVFDTLAIDKGVTIDGTGAVTDNFNNEGGQIIDNKGTINADFNGGTLTVNPLVFQNDGLAEATNGGTLTIASAHWVSEADGVISANGSGTTVDLVGGTVLGTVKISAGGTVKATGGSSNPTTFNGATVTDKGVLLATNGTTLTLQNTTVNAAISTNAITKAIVGGLIEAFDAAATVVLDGGTINGAAFETQTDGVITTQAGSNTTLNGTTIVAGTTVNVVDGSTVTLEGATTDMGSIAVGSAAGATLDVAAVGLTQPSLKGTGTVVLSDSVGNFIVAPAAGTTLTNSVTISGAGAIGNFGDGNLTFVNKGTVDATGVHALEIDTGHAVSNTGTLEATGGTGFGGLIVDDNVSGTGKALIASASFIELAGTLNTAAVTFGNKAGDTGLFTLDHAANPDALHGFHGTIAGFLNDGTNSDTLDLRDIKFGGGETWSYTQNSATKGTLTVSDGTESATLSLLGSYLAAAGQTASSSGPHSTLFALASDGGGTLVTTTHV
jgi:hypothetical protein